jgi:hypothetical protein
VFDEPTVRSPSSGATEADAPAGAPAVAVEDGSFRIGRYEIRGEVGRGTMGIVYRANDPSLCRVIALKTFHLSFAVSKPQYKSFEQRFFAEARIAAGLSHPGIVAVHDVGCDPDIGTLYIALEYLEGRTLQEVVKGGLRLDWREALRITCRLAEALHYAHSQGVVHRDIKPANIMLLPSGEPKILDFGIAKMETSHKLTTCQVFGTPLFMAPEQALGHKPDGRADLFSLGSIAYTLLTGHLAFEAPSIPATVRRLIEDDPVPPSRLVLDLPRGLDEVIARALAKKPNDRYSSGQELVEDIQGLLDASRAAGETVVLGSADALVDMEAQLAALVSIPGAITDPVPAARIRGARHPMRFLPPIVLAALSVFLVLGRPTPASEDTAELTPVTPVSAAPVLATPASPVSLTPAPVLPVVVTPLLRRSSPAAPALSESAAITPADNPPPGARLRIDFEHPLTSGTLRIWIDDQVVVQEELESHETTGIPGFRLPKGRFDREMVVRPGEHKVRVQVHWDDNDREESLSGGFPSGSARLLQINLGRVRKGLSLKWK